MDVLKALRELYEEKKRIDELIAFCEARLANAQPPPPARRRGRKSMSEEERKLVSQRMQAYWARKRQAGGGSGAPGSEGTP
jgi:hypothetical protein